MKVSAFNFFLYFCTMNTNFPQLNLPPIEAKVKKGSSGRLQIYDPQRRIFVTLTAEEWVRQHFVQYLINNLGYPAAVIGNEVGLAVGGVQRRSDTVVYSPTDGHPLLIIEYKAAHVSITQDVFMQIQSYNSVLRADYLVVSNGLHHYCCYNDYETMTPRFLPHIPRWAEIVKI